MDQEPDPEGPKTYGSGSGSVTLTKIVNSEKHEGTAETESEARGL